MHDVVTSLLLQNGTLLPVRARPGHQFVNGVELTFAQAKQATVDVQMIDSTLFHAIKGGQCRICGTVTPNPLKDCGRFQSSFLCRNLLCWCKDFDPERAPVFQQLADRDFGSSYYEAVANLETGTLQGLPRPRLSSPVWPSFEGILKAPCDRKSIPVIIGTRASSIGQPPPEGSHQRTADALVPLVEAKLQELHNESTLGAYWHPEGVHATGPTLGSVDKPTTPGLLAYRQVPGLLVELLKYHPFVCFGFSVGHLNAPTVSFKAWADFLVVCVAEGVHLNRVYLSSYCFLVAPVYGGRVQPLPDFCMFTLAEWQAVVAAPMHLPLPAGRGAVNLLTEIQRMAYYCQIEAHYGHVDQAWRNVL